MECNASIAGFGFAFFFHSPNQFYFQSQHEEKEKVSKRGEMPATEPVALGAAATKKFTKPARGKDLDF